MNGAIMKFLRHKHYNTQCCSSFYHMDSQSSSTNQVHTHGMKKKAINECPACEEKFSLVKVTTSQVLKLFQWVVAITD